MINYNNYPSLLFVSYNKDNAPAELPFEVASVEVQNYLSGSAGYQEMFAIMANLNSLGLSPSNYWLNDKKFKDVEYNDNFRNSHFRNFVSSGKAEIQYGCVCFKDGGQYVYLYLPADKARIKKVDGAYLCCALFKNNMFVGFEESILKNGFSVMPDGYYAGGMDIGGYLSFTSICLSFFGNGVTKLPEVINNTKEEIWTKN